MNEYLSTKKTRKILGVTTQTLRNWSNTDKIRTTLSASGIRLYNKEDIENIACGGNPITKEKIAYCRVSSSKQVEDLERQKNFFRTTYPDHILVTDIASGINWKRKGLKTILDRAMQRNISEVVVAHRDRLCRFSFELIKYILEYNSVKLTVLDADENKSSSDELATDVLSIIHVYSCREMGKRRYKSPKKEEKEIDNETDSGEEESKICSEI